MSVFVSAKVLRESEETLGRRLILLALADEAADDGVCWLGQEKIAARARLSRAHVVELMGAMRDEGVIEVRKAPRGRTRINVYRIMLPGLDPVRYDKLPFALDAPFSDEVGDSDIVTTSDPSADDVGSVGSTTSDPSGFLAVSPSISENVTGPVKGPGVSSGSFTVDRKRVTASELTLAQFILSAWNGRTGQDLTAKTWLSKIIMRIREHPDLSLDDHVAIIDRNLAHPWWRGAPSPAVIYGNDGVFEQSMQRHQNSNGNRVLEPSEVAEALRNA